jgi:NitT/TauT family transport system substrate-binding protein
LGLTATLATLKASPLYAQQGLQPIRYAFADAGIAPYTMLFAIPEIMGWYREEGLTVDIIPLPSSEVLMAALDDKRVDFVNDNAQFYLGRLAKGEKINAVFIMEHTYPGQLSMATLAGSPIKNFSDLRGKRVGISSFGKLDSIIGEITLRVAGLEPGKDVTVLAVGAGTSGAVALAHHDVDAVWDNDVRFGQMELLGLKLNYLPTPAAVPDVGGVFVGTSHEILCDHRPWAVGVLRGIRKAEIFMSVNLEAATYEFLQMYPQLAPKGKSMEEQVRQVMYPITKRIPHLAAARHGREAGAFSDKEWTDEIAVGGFTGKVTLAQAKSLYTNDLIAEANDFDAEKIRAQARNFVFPYKKN